MKRSIMRPLALGIATLSTVAGMAIGSVSASAASIGTFTFTPATGVDSNALTLDTSGPCPGGTNFQIAVFGAGFPAAGYGVTANNSDSILPNNAAGGYTIGLLDTMHNFAAAQSPPAVLSGDYTFTGTCKNAFGATTFGTFDGVVTFTQNGANAPSFVAHNPAAPAVGTTTTLASAPASPVDTATPVSFTAHVAANSGSATPAGTVQLMDGATAIGSPTAVDGSGNAVISTTFSTAGSHSVTAAFTGGTGFNNSTSAALAYTVTQAPADATVTALSISPSTATSADQVTLTASVSDTPHSATKPTGTVQFADGGTNIGSPVALVNGVATLTQSYSAGAHSFTASYLSNNANSFANSASTSQAYTVSAFTGVQTSEKIETTIAAGALTVSVADTSTVVLPSPQLNATATYLTTSGKIHPVTITDTRAGNPGWTLSGQVSDFVNTTGPTTTPIPGVDLGWTPNVIDKSPSQNVIAGSLVNPANPPLTANPAVADLNGLHVSRILASAAAGAGTGTAHVDALLALNVPTTTVAGTYDATLTLTAI
jgi:hypothetical protein